MALDMINRYWAEGRPGGHALLALHLLRDFRVAESASRASMLGNLKVNANDFAALRFILVESERDPVSPRALGAHLGITSASTTALINRLEKAGYLRREPHPKDRRALFLEATQSAKLLLEPNLQSQVDALLNAANAFTDLELITVERFLESVTTAIAPQSMGVD